MAQNLVDSIYINRKKRAKQSSSNILGNSNLSTVTLVLLTQINLINGYSTMDMIYRKSRNDLKRDKRSKSGGLLNQDIEDVYEIHCTI